jgi:molybdopterin-guanine dinucleotide biosynthesis protein A
MDLPTIASASVPHSNPSEGASPLSALGPEAERVQPVVLVGGRSQRFGRDKLREPWNGSEGGAWLVDQPRLALQRATGQPVWAVGDCDPAVAERFARHVPDVLAGAGPLSGLVAALAAAKGPVLVLAGDLPVINSEVLLRILEMARTAPSADAVLAIPEGDANALPEPCVGLYRPSFHARLRDALTPGKTRPMQRIVAEANTHLVPIEPALLVNANRPAELIIRPDPSTST